MSRAETGSSAVATTRPIDGVLQLLAGGHSTAAMIELVFGLFLISGMGFLYLRRRILGWAVLPLRLAVLVICTSVGSEIHPSLGPLGLLVGWAVPPVLLAHLVSRSKATPPAMQNQANVNAVLETLGWFGAGGIGWISSGRPAIGVTVLLVRFVMLAGGLAFLALFYSAAANECADGGDACVALQLGVLLAFVFWLALWLAFPVLSGALLRAANGQTLWVAVPRALVWIVVGLLALFLVPALLGLLIGLVRE